MSDKSFRGQEFELKKLDKSNEKYRIANENLVIFNDRFRAVTEIGESKRKLRSNFLDTVSKCLEPAKKSTVDIGYIFQRLKVEEQVPSENCDDILRIFRELMIKEAKNAIPAVSDQLKQLYFPEKYKRRDR